MAYSPVPKFPFATRTAPIPLAELDEDLTYLSQKVISVKDYGAVVDGVTDDSAAINLAFSSAPANATLVFTPGRYRVSSSLAPIPRGDITVIGYGATILLNAGVDGLFFHNASGGISNIKIKGLTIIADGAIGGFGIRFLDATFIIVDACTIENCSFGMVISVYQYPMITNCNIESCTGGIYLDVGDGAQILNCRINGTASVPFATGTKGIIVVNAGGTLVTQVDITRCEYGISLEPTSTLAASTYLTCVLTDTCGVGLWAAPGTPAAVQRLFASNCWFSVSDTANGGLGFGAYLENVSGVSFDNCVFYTNDSWGAFIDSSFNVTFSNCWIAYNNSTGLANVGGIRIVDSNNVIVNANQFMNDAVVGSEWSPANNNQTRGIIFTGVCDNFVVTDNSFTGTGVAAQDIIIVNAPSKATVRGNTTDNANSVASAAAIVVPSVFDVVHITGVINVTNITQANAAFIPNREIVLITDGACTIEDGNNFVLAGGADFVGAAGSLLTLMNIPGIGMAEKSRSIN